jgi:molybdate transport system permease protein
MLVALVPVLFLALALGAMLWRTSDELIHLSNRTASTLAEALRLSLLTSGASLLAILLLGTPLAYVVARKRFWGQRAVDTLVDLPIVLPPAVAGIALLMAFGRRGVIGVHLDYAGITLGFTTAAVVIAQTFVALPFFVRSAKAGFSSVHRDIEDAAAIDGAGPLRVLRDLTMHLAAAGLAAGAVLAWARALGEFGATIMSAGNFAGVTQTMPLAIYGRYEAGDLSTALLLSTVLLAFSSGILLLARLANGARRRARD